MLLCTVHKIKFNAMYRATNYLSPQSLYRILCPLIARRMNTLLTTFAVNVPWLFAFFHRHGISTLNAVWLSHTLQQFSSSCLPHLFIYMVAVKATICSKLLQAISLTRGQISELFKWCHPSANMWKMKSWEVKWSNPIFEEFDFCSSHAWG